MDAETRVVPPQLDAAALRDLVDTAFDALVITRAGAVVFANRSFVEMSGWTLEQILGRSVLDFVAPECHAPVMEQMRAGPEGRYEAQGLRRDGSRIDVEICARECVYQGEPARITAIRVITDRKQAEASLRRSEARLRQLIAGMTDMIVVYRAGGAVVFANPAAVAYLGCARGEEMIGMHACDLLHPGDRAAARARWPGADGPAIGADAGVAPEAGPLGVVRVARRDGSTGVVELAAVRIDDFDGAPATLVLGRDVAERRQLEARLVQAEMLASVGMLAAGIAHEINNPLAYVLLSLDVMARTVRRLRAELEDARADPAAVAALTTELGELVTTMREGADRVRYIVRDFRVFSRGVASDRPGPVDLRRVLESTIRIAFNDIRHRARLVCEFGPAPPVDADEPRLGQLFLNVLVNALQSLDAARSEHNEIRVTTRAAPDGSAVVEIADTGAGIAPEQLGRVFEPFFTTKPAEIGTGLGLPICRSIAASLGGAITLESEVGRGTLCRITLPAALAPARAASQPGGPGDAADAASAVSGRARVLVVDDEPALLQAVALELGREHEVRCARSPREALALLERECFDVVLCDVMMPDGSGRDLYQAIARARPGLERHVVFMTGGAFTPAAREFLRAVPNARLEKPFTWAELREALGRAR